MRTATFGMEVPGSERGEVLCKHQNLELWRNPSRPTERYTSADLQCNYTYSPPIPSHFEIEQTTAYD